MKNNITIKEITKQVEQASTIFERENTDLKRRYLVWIIEAFNTLAKRINVSRGTFGTGYPFYALDENLQGELPIISEQITYNRRLVQEGERLPTIYQCKECLDKKYATMPDLKIQCVPCSRVKDGIKPRRLINRLPDIDMWVICEDQSVSEAEEEMSKLLREYNMHTSDESPFDTIDEVTRIAHMLKQGKIPTKFLPMDVHIIEYSKIKELIEKVFETLKESENNHNPPYLPILPRSYRKTWQYDDEPYNFIFDYFAAFYPFDFPEELQQSLIKSRKQIANEYTTDQLVDVLLASATESSVRRFNEPKLREIFKNKVDNWRNLNIPDNSRNNVSER